MKVKVTLLRIIGTERSPLTSWVEVPDCDEEKFVRACAIVSRGHMRGRSFRPGDAVLKVAEPRRAIIGLAPDLELFVAVDMGSESCPICGAPRSQGRGNEWCVGCRTNTLASIRDEKAFEQMMLKIVDD